MTNIETKNEGSSHPVNTRDVRYFALIAFCVLAPFVFSWMFVILHPAPLLVLPDMKPKARPVMTDSQRLALAATQDIAAQTTIERSMLVFVWVKNDESFKDLVIDYDEAVGFQSATKIEKDAVLRKFQVDVGSFKGMPQ